MKYRVILLMSFMYSWSWGVVNLVPPTSLDQIYQDENGMMNFIDASSNGPTTLAQIKSFSPPVTWTVPLSANYVPLTINQLDTVNNPNGMVLTSTGTGQTLQINVNGRPSGGEQNMVGGVTINGPPLSSAYSPALLVVADSTTNNTNGAGLVEIWENNPAHNSYLLWIHGMSNRNSDEPIRFDGPTYGIDEVSTSTDSKGMHGIGKYKVISMANASNRLQLANSRSYDNSTFEHLIEVYPLPQTAVMPGFFLSPQNLDNGNSSVLVSSDTSGITFQGLNGSSVGLTGPLNPTATYVLSLPSLGAQGELLFHNGNRGVNFNARRMEWTNPDFTYSVVAGVTMSTASVTASLSPPSKTLVQLQVLVPSKSGLEFYCSDCVVDGNVISTGTSIGAFGRISARTTGVN